MAATLLHHVALVSETKSLHFKELAQVAAALQKQALRDFAPSWHIQSTVNAFADLDDVPLDYWPIIVRDDIHVNGASGIHLDKDGHPFALAQYGAGWSLTVSHECLEMLCDPEGSRVMAGPTPGQSKKHGRVEYLVEVCDPSESEAYAYAVNGVLVSDFYTPHFFDPVRAPGVRYSFSGAIEQPRQVLPGGYLSWHDPITDHWMQLTYFGAKPEIRDLGVLAQAEGSIRSQIYRRTQEAFEARRPKDLQAALQARGAGGAVQAASSAKARTLRAQIDHLLGKQ